MFRISSVRGAVTILKLPDFELDRLIDTIELAEPKVCSGVATITLGEETCDLMRKLRCTTVLGRSQTTACVFEQYDVKTRLLVAVGDDADEGALERLGQQLKKYLANVVASN